MALCGSVWLCVRVFVGAMVYVCVCVWVGGWLCVGGGGGCVLLCVCVCVCVWLSVLGWVMPVRVLFKHEANICHGRCRQVSRKFLEGAEYLHASTQPGRCRQV